MSIQNQKKNILMESRDILRRMHYSIHTELAYCDWIGRYVRFHHMQVRENLFGEPEKKVEEFLTHLAIQANVAVSMQRNGVCPPILLQVRKLTLTGLWIFSMGYLTSPQRTKQDLIYADTDKLDELFGV